MTISALSTAGLSQFVLYSSNLNKSQKAWQSLEQNLAAGNLSGAQSAFNSYQQANQNLLALGAASTPANTQLNTDMTALSKALSSGNLSDAQSAFASVQNDLKTTPSQTTPAAAAAMNQAVQMVDDLLTLSSAATFSSTPADPTVAILGGAFGVNTSPNISDPATAVLNTLYRAYSSSNLDNIASASGNGAIESSTSSQSSASVNTYA
ncbi:MAG: hypothetical protein ABSE99_00205 [Terracidiphilus sp.]|jgi:hypothetical protein